MSAITGIGASILPSPAGGFEISSLSATGNARLHLQVGDRIMSIGSVATSEKTDVEVKNLILGPAGSTISMVCAAPRPCLAPMAQLTFASRRSLLVGRSTNQFLSAAMLLQLDLPPLQLLPPLPPQLPPPLRALRLVSLSSPPNPTTAPRSPPLFPTALRLPQVHIFYAEKRPYSLQSHRVSDAASGLLQDDVILSFGASQLSSMPHPSAIAGAASSNII